MTAQADKNFHGEAKVTRAQAIIAVAKLAQSLEAGKWVVAPSARVPSKFLTAPLPGDWKKQPLRRYALASVLARLGDYIANGLPRPPAGSKDVGQSIILPQKATLSIPKSHPAYDALDYLTRNRMLWPNAALLKPDDQPVLGAELSQALAQMTVGLTDRLTELGHDANGDSIDVNSPKKKPSGNR